MGAKADLERELAFCRGRIQALEKQLIAAQSEKTEQLTAAQSEKTVLFEQINKLQDSLISIKAPDAYRDQQLEREGPLPGPSAETIERNKITAKFTTDYLNGMEGPLFRSPDDLDDLITTGIIRDTSHVPASTHGNNES